MQNSDKSKLYQEEFDFIFSTRGSGVRRVTVISALIEAQIFFLANRFLENKEVIYKPESKNEYNQSLNVLWTNKILTSEDLKEIENFRKARNKSIHAIFKGMTREEWNKQNELAINMGRPIVRKLDEKLYPNE